jgi:hypothetical protein
MSKSIHQDEYRLTLCFTVLALTSSLASADTPTLSIGVGVGALPARQDAARVEVNMADVAGQTWSWSFDAPGSMVAPGIALRADLRWKRFTVGLTADAYLRSFAGEAGKQGHLYGAALAMPLGVRFPLSRGALTTFAAPTVMFGGFGFGSFGRIDNKPIDFGGVRFFDDETAVHLLEKEFAVAAGLDVEIPVTEAVSLFATVGGSLTMFRSRRYNIAGFTDEAQSDVTWFRQPLSSAAVQARFDGQPVTVTSTRLSLDGLRFVVGVNFRLFQ